MKEASARSSRASAPVSTTKRAPDSFAARSKSIIPSASPSSKCSFGGNSKDARFAPAAQLDVRRFGGRPARPRPEDSGSCASAACSSASAGRTPRLQVRLLLLAAGDLVENVGRVLAPRLPLADLLGERVPPRLDLLGGGERVAPRLIEG